MYRASAQYVQIRPGKATVINIHSALANEGDDAVTYLGRVTYSPRKSAQEYLAVRF
jgi:hypothetical protein